MMNRSRRGILAVVMAAVAMLATAAVEPSDRGGGTLDHAIDSTDQYLARRQEFARAKAERIEARRHQLDRVGAGAEAAAMIDLGREFRRYNVDSAARYFTQAIDAAAVRGDSSTMKTAMLELAAVNPLRGIIKESVDMYDAIDSSSLRDSELTLYYDKGFDVYVTTAEFYNDDYHGNEYRRKALQFSDSLVSRLPEGSAEQLYYKGWSAMRRGDLPTALTELKSALGRSSFGEDLYARATASLADYYMNYVHDRDKAAYYLALSTMSDVAAGTKETTSLQRLGLDLYKRGDIVRAHRYMSVALENSIESGSKVRTLAEVNTFPVVSKAYRDRDYTRMRWLYVLVGVLTAAMIALAVMVWIIYRSKRRLASYRQQLTTSNMHKDAYINQILAICSSYIERIEELNRLIVRKVKTGQSQDLCRMVESGEMMREQSDKFLRSFDKALLSIYPDFVGQLNGLLRDDARFGEPSGSKLSPELRIAAFMRLGVDDSARIARLLGLSLNTVYTYRNKLRNRAKDRENFEADIEKIGNIAKL